MASWSCGPVRAARPGRACTRRRPGSWRAGRAGRGPASPADGSYLAIAEPIRYRAHRIPYAYSAEDFALHVTSPAGTGSPGTLVLSVSLARISQATDHLAVILLAASGLVLLAAGCLAAWVIRAALRPDRVAPALSAVVTQVEQLRVPAGESRVGGPAGRRAETPGHRRCRPGAAPAAQRPGRPD